MGIPFCRWCCSKKPRFLVRAPAHGPPHQAHQSRRAADRMHPAASPPIARSALPAYHSATTRTWANAARLTAPPALPAGRRAPVTRRPAVARSCRENGEFCWVVAVVRQVAQEHGRRSRAQGRPSGRLCADGLRCGRSCVGGRLGRGDGDQMTCTCSRQDRNGASRAG